MKKVIRKPENWQDFESLCKKLWGEIWEIPGEIKKNGRLGQAQSGVDVYGVPNRTTYAYNDTKTLKYLPSRKSTLIQKDTKIITCFLKAFPKVSSISIRWELLARDFRGMEF